MVATVHVDQLALIQKLELKKTRDIRVNDIIF